MTDKLIGDAKSDIENLLTEKFSTEKKGLSLKLKAAGRNLPRGVRANAQYILYTEARTNHPKKRHLVNPTKIEAAHKSTLDRLSKVDLARDKDRARINWLGGLVMNIIAFGVVYYALLVWLGAS